MSELSKIIIESGIGEIVEKKSRFIAHIIRVDSEEEALSFIESKKKEFWDAKHNCYAYIIGENKEISRFSDDKEPSGTAGKPILEVLQASGLINAAIVVTRYFGGVLLGTGGLVRAYSAAAAAALANSKYLPLQRGNLVNLDLGYDISEKIKYLLTQNNFSTLSTDYQESVHIKLAVAREDLDSLTKKITEATNASVIPEISDSIRFCDDNGKVILI